MFLCVCLLDLVEFAAIASLVILFIFVFNWLFSACVRGLLVFDSVVFDFVDFVTVLCV